MSDLQEWVSVTLVSMHEWQSGGMINNSFPVLLFTVCKLSLNLLAVPLIQPINMIPMFEKIFFLLINGNQYSIIFLSIMSSQVVLIFVTTVKMNMMEQWNSRKIWKDIKERTESVKQAVWRQISTYTNGQALPTQWQALFLLHVPDYFSSIPESLKILLIHKYKPKILILLFGQRMETKFLSWWLVSQCHEVSLP